MARIITQDANKINYHLHWRLGKIIINSRLGHSLNQSESPRGVDSPTRQLSHV